MAEQGGHVSSQTIVVEPVARLVGHVAVPGDKSISHRAVLIGAVCEHETRIAGFGRSADTEATIAAVRALGAEVEEDGIDLLRVRGKGLTGLSAPDGPIDCANAGTLVRLVSGILAGQQGRTFTLSGDASLSRRPMERIAEPLRRMGAEIQTVDGHLPLTIGGAPLGGIDYALPVASAQVKSAVLLAGLYADGETTVVEPAPTRDHTERMLAAAGAHVTVRPTSVTVRRPERLSLGRLEVPGDFSSAAPFLVAATLVPGSELHVHGVNLNPRRTGLLAILERMGAQITVYNRREIGGEPGGDLEVHAAPLVGTTVAADEVPIAIDELPLFALAAAHARGESVLRGAEELRAKETDRIEATVDALRALGARARATDDGLRITGVPARPRGGRISSRGDHRLAMLGAVAGLASREGVRVEGADAVAVSFPGFFEMLEELRRTSAVVEDDRR
jgi:3-phosphoshikimate 1-carboxyvinyltransferase